MTDLNKWMLEEDGFTRRRLGKTNEELHELGKVINRILLQGIDATDPSTGELLIDQLHKEIADVYAQLDETLVGLQLDTQTIWDRRRGKREQMKVWEDMYE
jgi:hypothetical protein